MSTNASSEPTASVYRIELRHGNTIIPADLMATEPSTSGDRDECALHLAFEGAALQAVADNYFDALVQLRKELETRGLKALVYGASRNVWPSPMALSMGYGLRAYRMTMGKQALTEDLVNIFEAGPDVEPVSVEEQRQYRDAWFQSL